MTYFKRQFLQNYKMEVMDRSYPTNALCSSHNDTSKSVIFLHPFMIKKTLEYINNSETILPEGVHLKMEYSRLRYIEDDLEDPSEEITIDTNYSIPSFNGNVFQTFKDDESLKSMSYTYLITVSKIEDPVYRFEIGLLISPISDDLEVVSKHLHMLAYYKTDYIYAGGEVVAERNDNGNIYLYVNSLSGTVLEALQELDDVEEPIDGVEQLRNRAISEAFRMIPGIKKVVFEEVNPFSKIIPNTRSTLGVINMTDKLISDSEIDTAINSGFSKRCKPHLSVKQREKHENMISLSRKILHVLVRPRLYSDKLDCNVIGFLLNIARFIIEVSCPDSLILKLSDTFIMSFQLKLVETLLEEVQRFSVGFDTLRDNYSETTGIILNPSGGVFASDVERTDIFDHSGLTLTNTKFGDYGSITLGSLRGSGNYGSIYDVKEIDIIMDKKPTEGLKLVAKISVIILPISKNAEFPVLSHGKSLLPYSSITGEKVELMNAYSLKTSKTIDARFQVSIQEDLEIPSFSEDKEQIMKDILKDWLRVFREKYIHMDIKPENVMKNSSGKHILIDFGISAKHGVNGTGGTPYYIAEFLKLPEGKHTSVSRDLMAIMFMVFELFKPESWKKYTDNYKSFEGANNSVVQLELLNDLDGIPSDLYTIFKEVLDFNENIQSSDLIPEGTSSKSPIPIFMKEKAFVDAKIEKIINQIY